MNDILEIKEIEGSDFIKKYYNLSHDQYLMGRLRLDKMKQDDLFGVLLAAKVVKVFN